jgi:FMNH2-dependent dimethyl sulfone monooxygenase
MAVSQGSRVASERHGFDLSLIAELNLNDIKGHRAPSLDCWTLAPAVAAVTSELKLMLAVSPVTLSAVWA